MLTGKPASTSGRREVRKQFRLHRKDAALIESAASSAGLRESDFIREAVISRAQEVDEQERNMSVSVLPVDVFEKLSAELERPGKFIPGLARAAKAAERILKSVD